MFQKLITVVAGTFYFVDRVSFLWIFFELGQTHLDFLHRVELLCLVTISNHVQLTDTVLLIKAAIKIGVISLYFVKKLINFTYYAMKASHQKSVKFSS